MRWTVRRRRYVPSKESAGAPRQRRHRNAVTELRQVLKIYQRLDAAEATQLATDLTDLDAE